jgi:hypothetical protein
MASVAPKPKIACHSFWPRRNGRWQIAHGHNTVIDPVAQPFDAIKLGSPHQDR